MDEEEVKKEERAIDEEQFQRYLMHAKMISRLQTTLPEGEPSRRAKDDAEDGLFEEKL